MAGIVVPQYDIFKIETKLLKYHNWSLEITKDEAYTYDALVSLFESQIFRLIAKILNQPIEQIDFSEYIAVIVISTKSHFRRATDPAGININGKTFKRFVGTSGGLKKNSIIYVSSDIITELNKRCECGRKMDIPMVPAKYETYKALTCSASQPICEPRGILVVSDCTIKIRDIVKIIDDSGDNPEPIVSDPVEMELENNVCDGFNLCTPEYMERIAESLGTDYVPSGVCLRNAWLKGMLYPFPIIEFADEIAGGDYMVQDIWGDWHDIRDIDLILNESSLKLWKCYDSIDDYIAAYRKNGYGFSVTKMSPNILEDQRMTNYQYLQSYDLTDEDIRELCEPTIKWLKDSMGGDYESTLHFLGINDQVEKNSWQEALFLDKRILDDPFIIKSIHRMIRLKIDEAKIGKLIVNGNYQLASGDPYIFMEHVFSMDPKGLLQKNECYSQYWADLNVNEIVAFRSPMTVHNNIRKCTVVKNDNTARWYRYMTTIFIINGFDSFCAAENGCDYDGDLIFTTNNAVLIRKHRMLPAILCKQKNTEKIIPTEADILATNINAMGNQVGSITNRVTSMMDKQAGFTPGSKEYLEIQKRIECGQLYQQNEIDKIKGIVAKPMPDYWYTPASCNGDDYQYSICTSKKPYFMMYVYESIRAEYKKYLKNADEECRIVYGKPVEEVLAEGKETEFINKFYHYSPLSNGHCTMNRICHYVEGIFSEYKQKQDTKSHFDNSFLKYGVIVDTDTKNRLIDLAKSYCQEYSAFRKKGFNTRNNYHSEAMWLKKKYRDLGEKICPDEKKRLDIVLDLGFENKFVWNCVGKLIIQRIREVNHMDE